MYGSWDMERDGQNFVILDYFLPFYHPTPHPTPNNPKNQNFEKMKKKNIWRYGNYMIYDSWDMEHDRQNFLSVWTIFCHFTPLKPWKIKILKKWKKTPGNIIILHKCTKNHDICYTVLEIQCVTDVIIFYFGLFFALLPPP